MTTEPSVAQRHSIQLAAGFGFVVLVTAFRLFVFSGGELTPDESYYFLWSQYPAASYYDHPPMVAWWIAVSTALFGETSLAIRSLFVAAAIPISAFIYFTGRTLFDHRIGLLGALWFNAMPLAGIGVSATPDAPSVLFWSATVLVLARIANGGSGAWWLVVGLTAGLGVLSKLTGLFLGVGIVAWLLLYAPARRWLLSPWPWLGGLVALLVVTPMLLWNLEHEWITFTKQMSRFDVGDFRIARFVELIVVQYIIMNPLVVGFAFLAVLALLRRRLGEASSGMVMLVWTTLPLMAYMVAYSFREQVNANWLAPIFPAVALAAGAGAVLAPGMWGWLRRVVLPLGIAMWTFAFVMIGNPGQFLPQRLDVGQSVRGWAGVAKGASDLRAEIGATWVATTHYAVTASIAYHMPDKTAPVIPIAERRRYDFAPKPAAVTVSGLALVVTAKGLQEVESCFDTVERVGVIERMVPYTAQTLNTYRAEGFRSSALETGCCPDCD